MLQIYDKIALLIGSKYNAAGIDAGAQDSDLGLEQAKPGDVGWLKLVGSEDNKGYRRGDSHPNLQMGQGRETVWPASLYARPYICEPPGSRLQSPPAQPFPDPSGNFPVPQV